MSIPIRELLDSMWNDYLLLNPQARQVRDLFESRGEQVVNDHIAFRTYDLPGLDIDTLARPFLAAGYRPGGRYEFPEKKLDALHFEPPSPDLPLVFISALDVSAFPEEVQRIIRELAAQVDPADVARDDFLYSGRPWRLDLSTYEALLAHSEYAAWVAAFGYRPNHFTVRVNDLCTLPSLEAVNELLEQNGFVLNASGGKIKGSPEQLLEQSSTLANRVEVAFSDTRATIPSCYYEFARRYAGPDGELYMGFIAASADRIFESTDRRLGR